MALESFVALNLSSPSYSEPFHRRSIALDLGHVALLLFDLLCCVCLLWRKQHRHAPPLYSWFNVDFRDVSELIDNSAQHLFAQLGMGDFTSAEEYRYFDALSLLNELANIPYL